MSCYCVGIYTHSGSDNSAVSVSIDSADDSRNEVKQREDAVVAQFLHIIRHNHTRMLSVLQ